LGELATIPTEPMAAFAARLAECVSRLLGVERTEALVADDDGGLRPLASLAPVSSATPEAGRQTPRGKGGRGNSASERASARRAAGQRASGPLAEVYRTATPLLCNDTRVLPALAVEVSTASLRSVLAVPLFVGEMQRGVVWAGTARPDAFTPEDETFLTLVAARVGLRLGTAELARRRAEIERAEVEQQAKQDFLSVVSHELKTPVAVIKAYTEVLEGRRPGAAPRRPTATCWRGLASRRTACSTWSSSSSTSSGSRRA
jgi:signal transduction histidine kinase